MENLYQKISYIKAATGNLSKTMLNFNKAISMYLLWGGGTSLIYKLR